VALRSLRKSPGETIREGEASSGLIGGELDAWRARDARLHAAHLDRVAETSPLDVEWPRLNRLFALAARTRG
jgi:hypothetical protein